MSQELQGLLDRIQKDGIEQAEVQKEAIINDTKKNADALLSRTKMESEAILKHAKEEASSIEERSKATIRQAARDISISLESELLNRLKKVIKENIDLVLNKDFILEIIKKMVDSYAKGENKALQLILSQKDIDRFGDSIKATLTASLKTTPEILCGNNLSGGVKVGFKGSDVLFDFSDASLTDIIIEYVGPRLAAIIKGE